MASVCDCEQVGVKELPARWSLRKGSYLHVAYSQSREVRNKALSVLPSTLFLLTMDPLLKQVQKPGLDI